MPVPPKAVETVEEAETAPEIAWRSPVTFEKVREFEATRAEELAVPVTASIVEVAFVVVDFVTTRSWRVVSPKEETERNLVAFEVEAISKSGVVCVVVAWIARFARGVVVPSPTLPVAESKRNCVPFTAPKRTVEEA
jgi:hypothetical protein